jgi:hypothetical protein
MSAAKTYEMLWDCEYCGAKKLLGLTHRHCPECGAAQDPKRRYFPEESEKVAVEDHRYVGADVHYPACQAPMSAAVKFCTVCGAPLAGGGQVARVAEPKAAGEAEKPGKAPSPKKKGQGRKLAVIFGAVAVVIAIVIALATCKKEVALTAVGHAWQREIQIESFAPRDEDAWCDALPSGAYAISRSQEVRSYKEIPDGQKCSKERKDNGDGTYSEVEKCVDKTRKEPVYDDKCRFKIDKWGYARSVVAKGQSLAEAPGWPAVALAGNGQGLGAERQGARVETYTVFFSDPASPSAQQTCAMAEARWRSMPVGSKWKGRAGVVTGALDCDSLAPLGGR